MDGLLPELQGQSGSCTICNPPTNTHLQALKKIINSYAAGRPASDASLLSLGQRPAKRTFSETTSSRIDGTPEPSFSLDSDATPLDELDIPTTSLTASRGHGNGNGTPASGIDLDPLPPETEPPAPSRTSILDSRNGSSDGRNESFKAHRDVFFFTLQRELEKVRPSSAPPVLAC